jgi:hypothetical protein
MRDGGPIDSDVVFIVESKELLFGELHAIVVMMEFGTPKQWMMLRKNSMACSNLTTEIGQASIHFVNLSMVTSKWV